MLWFWAATAAAVLWGITYATTEHVLKSGISMISLLAMYGWISMPVFTAAAIYNGNLGQGFEIIRGNPKIVFWMVLIVASFFLGNLLIYWAISQKNAVAVSFIEISYPFFVALFSWLIFNQNNMTLGTLLGGLLIFGGVSVMYFVK